MKADLPIQRDLSDQLRNDAASLAWSVPGVFKIENLLAVQPEASDAY